MNQLQESIREAWEKLSPRERQLLSIMGSVGMLIFVFVAVWTSSSAVANVEEERDEIRKVLTDISRAGEVLAKRDAERMAMEARFQNPPPPLAAYLEGKAKAESLEVRQVVEQPAKEIAGYRRQNVRMHFSGVSLRPVVRFLTSIEEEPMPIAIERLSVEHYTAGDVYKVEVGVVAFERKKGAPEDKSPGEAGGEESAP